MPSNGRKRSKILIINKSFELGGIQMALANMLDVIHDQYDVTLAVFYPQGPFKDRIPENVKILSLSPLVQVLGMNGSDCKRSGSLGQKIFKVVGGAWAKLFGNTLPVKIAMAFQKDVGAYDVVISYHQETSAKTILTGFGEFALKKCKAPQKIAWVHADFQATKLATKKNWKIYRHFDKIVGVSRVCMDRFIAAYPSFKEKCDYCYNCIPIEDIKRKASAMQNVFQRNDNTTVLFSACRLVEEKGLVPALESLLPIWKSDVDVKWYIAGEGPEREKLEAQIQAHHLEEKVILMGFQSNPYPFFREADFLMLPSLHETFSIVVSEAHALGTPVIASDIPVMQEMLGEGDILWDCKNGMDLLGAFAAGKSSRNIKYEADEFLSCFSRIIEEENYAAGWRST